MANNSLGYNVGGSLFNGLADGISSIPLVGGLLSSPFQAIGNAFSVVGAEQQDQEDKAYNAQQAQLNRDFQRQERLATQEYNLDMWNRNNEYNSLASQVERAREAGFSPNAILDKGSGNIASSPMHSSPMSGSQASIGGSLASSMLTANAQNAMILAQTRNIEADTENKKYELSWNKLSETQRLELLELQGDNLVADLGIKDVDKRTKEEMLVWLSKKNEEELKILKQNLINLKNENEHIIKQITKTEKETESIEKDVEFKEYQNAEQKLKTAFAQASGLPAGTKLTDASFYTWLTGNFPSVIDKATSTALKYADEFPDRVYNTGKEIYRQAKRNIKRVGGFFKSLFNPHL